MKRLKLFSRVWADRLLTVLLIVLVGASLALSALIWTGTPARMTVDRPGFFSSPGFGNHRPPYLLIRPQAIWLWTSKNELYRIGGSAGIAQQIMRDLAHSTVLKGRLFKAENQGIPPLGAYLRLDFGASLLQPSLLSMLLGNVPAGLGANVDGSLYVSPTARQNVYRLSYLSDRDQVYVGLLTAPSSLARALQPDNAATPYAQIPVGKNVYDLPYDAVSLPVQDWTLGRPATARMVNSFFTDPTVVQSLSHAPHDVLYTDGMRGVRVTRGVFGDDVDVSNPSGTLRGATSREVDSALAAVSFVNEHGGFVGDQAINISPGDSGIGAFSIFFRQLINGWPLFGELSSLHITMQGETATGFTRTLAYLNDRVSTSPEVVLSGMQIINQVGVANLRDVTGISLGYGTRWLGSDMVQLAPVYRLRFADGFVEYLDAHDGSPFVGTGM